jgi:hypothetical protein
MGYTRASGELDWTGQGRELGPWAGEDATDPCESLRCPDVELGGVDVESLRFVMQTRRRRIRRVEGRSGR